MEKPQTISQILERMERRLTWELFREGGTRALSVTPAMGCRGPKDMLSTCLRTSPSEDAGAIEKEKPAAEGREGSCDVAAGRKADESQGDNCEKS